MGKSKPTTHERDERFVGRLVARTTPSELRSLVRSSSVYKNQQKDGGSSPEGVATGQRAQASDRSSKLKCRSSNRKYFGRLMGGTYHIRFGRGRT